MGIIIDRASPGHTGYQRWYLNDNPSIPNFTSSDRSFPVRCYPNYQLELARKYRLFNCSIRLRFYSRFRQLAS